MLVGSDEVVVLDDENWELEVESWVVEAEEDLVLDVDT